MYTIFYTNISDFYENLEVMLDEGMYKTPRKNAPDWLGD